MHVTWVVKISLFNLCYHMKCPTHMYVSTRNLLNTYTWREAFVWEFFGRGWVRNARQPKLMHHPISFHPFGSSSSVEHKRLLQTNALPFRGIYRPVSSSGLPKPSSCDPIWTCTVPVFSVPWTVEVPLFLPCACQLFLCIKTTKWNQVKCRKRVV